MRNLLTVLLTLCLAASLRAAEKPRKLGDSGDARGFILDAETNAYLGGAKVELMLPPNTEAVKDSAGVSVTSGYFQIKAPLGTISTRFATERLLDLSLVSVLLGGGKKTTRHITVSQLNLRVTKAGYKSYSGPVLVFEASAEGNFVWLCPIYLAPDNQAYLSYASLKPDIGRVDRIELSNLTPEAGEEVRFKMAVSHMPLAPKDDPTLHCLLMPGLLDARGSRNSNGEVMVFEGSIGMKRRTFELFNDRKPPLKPGLVAMLLEVGAGKASYGEVAPAPHRSHLATLQYVAVGPPPERKAEIASMLSQLNLLLIRHDEGAGKLLARAASMMPKKAAEGNRFADTFASGDYQGAWKMVAAADGKLGEEEQRLFDAVKAAAAVQKNPADYRPRLTYRMAADAWLAHEDDRQRDGKPLTNEAMDAAFRSAKFPSLPPPAKPEDKLVAGILASLDGNDREAITIFQGIVDDPKAGTQAKIELANYHYRQGEFPAALSMFDAAFHSKDAQSIRGFYPHLRYGLLLFHAGKRSEAEEVLARGLLYAKSRTFDYSRPASTGTVGGSSIQVFSGAMRSGSVGYVYPEGAAVQVLLTNYSALDQPDTDRLSASVAARAMAELGLGEEAARITSEAVRACPTDQSILAAHAVALQASGQYDAVKKTISRLLEVNPRNPEGGAFVDVGRKQPQQPISVPP